MVGNAGSGIESGVSGLAGTVVLTNGSPSVTINGKSAVRHGDDCKMNCDEAKLSNVPGKIYTSAPMARLSSQAHNINNPVLRNIALANLQIEQWKQQASDELIRGTEHFFKSTKDSLVTLSDATGITGTSAESQAARGRMLAGAQALGTLMGPPPEMVQGAYMSGNAQYIAQVEQMQRNQQAAWGQVGNSIATAWTEANARSGPVGAVTMVFTAIGWNVAAGAATGAGAGLAARIAVNVGGKVLQVSAGVGRTIAEVLATAKNPAQAAKGLEEAAAAAKAAGASAYDVEALTAAKDAVLKGPTAPKVPAGDSPVNGAVIRTTPQEAGSIRNVNPGFPDAPGRTQNCVNCSQATDSTLGGNPASALPSRGPVGIDVLERQYGGRFSNAMSSSTIEQQMIDAGAGARGIVFGARGPGEVGHVFNVINQNGTVRFLDGQVGAAANLNGYTNFHLLRTTTP